MKRIAREEKKKHKGFRKIGKKNKSTAKKRTVRPFRGVPRIFEGGFC